MQNMGEVSEETTGVALFLRCWLCRGALGVSKVVDALLLETTLGFPDFHFGDWSATFPDLLVDLRLEPKSHQHDAFRAPLSRAQLKR